MKRDNEGRIKKEWLRLFRSRKKPNRARQFAWKNGRAKRAELRSSRTGEMTAHATSVGRAGSSVLKLTRFRRGCLGKREKEDPQ